MDSDFYSHNNNSENGGYYSESNYNNQNEPQTERVDAQFQGNGFSSFTPEMPSPPVISKQKKNDSLKLKILIPVMCLVCALIGGVCGGLTAAHFKTDTKTAETTQSGNKSGENESSKSIESLYSKDDNNSNSVNSGAGTVVKGDSSDSSDGSEAVLSAKEVYKNCVNSVVYVETSGTSAGLYQSSATSSGSGFIVTDSGYIVTNYHVVEGGKSYKVTTYDNKEYDAKLIGYEESNDIAVLKIEGDSFQSVKYGNSSSISVGDDVYVIGNPLGDLTYTLTSGVVSALNRLIKSDDGSLINMFQTDAAVNSGNSGGPVFDSTGSVVGIATAKYASSSIEGLSFCIPINDVRSMIDDIINQGYVSGKASLGVSVYDAGYRNYSYFSFYTSSTAGAKVMAVGNGTAAQKAGIKENDTIVAIDGYTVDSVSTLKTYLTAFKAGDTVKITVSRNGAKSDITVTLDEYTPQSSRTNYTNVYDL